METINVELTAEQWKSVRIALSRAEDQADDRGDVIQAKKFGDVYNLVCDQTHPKQLWGLK